MIPLKKKIKDFLCQRQAVIHQPHEQEYAAKKLFEMFEAELQRNKPKNSLLLQVHHYKSALKLLKVPKIIIENPQFIRKLPMSRQDIELAKSQIQEHQEYLSFQRRQERKQSLTANKPIKN